MNRQELAKKANDCPRTPGVYQMKNAAGAVIYVGKAKVLKNRVSSYFRSDARHTLKTRRMVSLVDDFEVIETDSELEALLLENTLIKHFRPRYNILLKDDKGYPFIRMNPHLPYPVLEIAARREADEARYFGPYGGRTVAREVIGLLQETFRLPTCSRQFPRDIGRERPCLRMQLGRCQGFCTGQPDAAQYRELMEQAALLLEGKCTELQESLQARMEEAAEALRFEQAALYRDRLRALEKLGQRQKVVAAHVPDVDLVCLYSGAAKTCVAVLHYLEGTLMGKDRHFLERCEEEEEQQELLAEFLQQYYRDRPILPREVALSHEIPDAEVLEQWLSQTAGRKVSVLHPRRGPRFALMQMAMENAREEARQATTREERHSAAMELLQKAAGLDAVPRRLEAYDVSHEGGENAVGGMVVFEGGRPLKSAYRKFALPGHRGDDLAAMTEMLTRRASEAAAGDEKFLPLPDLVLMDGDDRQARVAREIFRAAGFEIPVLGMVKDDRHRTRALIDPEGREIGLVTRQALFALVGTVQEEVHRFAVTFHRQKSQKSMRHSALDGIPTLGSARKAALLKHFGSIRGIRAATLPELEKVVPRNSAAAVYAAMHGQK